MVSVKENSNNVLIDGESMEVYGPPPVIGSVLRFPGEGTRIIHTMPTFEGCDPLPAREFAKVANGVSSGSRCFAISLDYAPVRSAWGKEAGWLTPVVDFAKFNEYFGVFVPRIGLFLPALFVIDASDHLLYSEICDRLDATVNFQVAQKVFLEDLDKSVGT